MFIENKYYRWYLALTARDDVGGYTEEHHKIPRALGGTNARANLVRLTARKHFLVHWLLTKCTAGEQQRAMFWAFACMSRNPSGERNLSSWQFARARESYSHAAKQRPSKLKGRKLSPERCLQMSRDRKGAKLSEEHRAKIGKGLKGKTLGLRKGKPRKTPLTPEQVIAYRERMIGNTLCVGLHPSEETKAKLSAALKGNKRKLGFSDPEETIHRKRLAQLERPTWGEGGLKGISKFKQNGVWKGKWRSRIKAGPVFKHLGLFDCPAAAHLVYIVAADTVRRGESI